MKKIFKDKEGNRLTFKEFMARWKSGIEGITPLQQVKVQIKSTVIVLIGIVCGFVISVMNANALWWLALILGGAFGNTIIQYIGLIQKRNQLMAFEGLEEMSLSEVVKGGNRK